MNAIPAILPAAAAALVADTARRNLATLPVGTRVMDFSTGARGVVELQVIGSPMLYVRLDNGTQVMRYPSALSVLAKVNADRPVGNGKLPNSLEVWA